MTDDRPTPRTARRGHAGRPSSPVLVALGLVLAVGGCSAARPSAVVEGTLAKRSQTTREAVVETPEALATRLTSIETAIRDPATPDAELDRLGRSQQDLYRMVSARPEWRPTVTASVSAGVRSAVEANLKAESELTRLGEPGPDLPHWHIVAPAPWATLLADYKAAEAAVGVPWPYLAAIHLTETRMSRIRGNSSAGAQGPMQFLPATWAIYGAGGDINSDHDAILAAARLLKSRGAPGDMSRALFAYNNSDHYVKAIVAYAEIIGADERAYRAYHAWQVYYGDHLLPEGFSNP